MTQLNLVIHPLVARDLVPFFEEKTLRHYLNNARGTISSMPPIIGLLGDRLGLSLEDVRAFASEMSTLQPVLEESGRTVGNGPHCGTHVQATITVSTASMLLMAASAYGANGNGMFPDTPLGYSLDSLSQGIVDLLHQYVQVLLSGQED